MLDILLQEIQFECLVFSNFKFFIDLYALFLTNISHPISNCFKSDF